MQAVVTAVGPDHRGLADPIVHSVTELGANIAEIQMYDRDDAHVFSMLTRVEIAPERYGELRAAMTGVADATGLSIRAWSPDLPRLERRKPRLAICVTFRPETPLALLRAIRDGRVRAEATAVLSNRTALQGVAEQFGVPFHLVGDERGEPDNDALIALCDELAIDYVVLARYMRVLPPESCWKYAGGRILNLHHGLLPSFPGMRPYHDAYAARMLTFGATCHFIVPELDAGNQIVNQATFSVPPGTSLDEVIRRGQEDNEPACLVEGVRRVVDGEVRLCFNRVVATRA